MSQTPVLEISLLAEAQANKIVSINQAVTALDEFAGRVLAAAVKTGSAAWTAADGLFLLNLGAAATLTLPPVSGANAPRPGQRFMFCDATGNVGANHVTVAVPGGAKLDGIVDGTAVFAGDGAFAEIVFVGQAEGYRIVRCRHMLDAVDQFASVRAWMRGAAGGYAGAVLPATGNHVPGYLPFSPPFPVSVDQAVFVFGEALPVSDATTARARVWFHDGSMAGPGALRFGGAVQDVVLQGAGHARETNRIQYSYPGTISLAVAPAALAARRYFDGGALYYLGYHLESAFSGGQGVEIGRMPLGMAPLMRSGGGQAWPFSPGANPAVAEQGAANQLQRLEWGFRYRRLIER